MLGVVKSERYLKIINKRPSLLKFLMIKQKYAPIYKNDAATDALEW